MKRLRGLILILATIPAWAYVVHFDHVARNSVFGYELGSVAMPYPRHVLVLDAIALVFMLIGLWLLISDLIGWIRHRFYGRAN